MIIIIIIIVIITRVWFFHLFANKSNATFNVQSFLACAQRRKSNWPKLQRSFNPCRLFQTVTRYLYLRRPLLSYSASNLTTRRLHFVRKKRPRINEELYHRARAGVTLEYPFRLGDGKGGPHKHVGSYGFLGLQSLSRLCFSYLSPSLIAISFSPDVNRVVSRSRYSSDLDDLVVAPDKRAVINVCNSAMCRYLWWPITMTVRAKVAQIYVVINK